MRQTLLLCLSIFFLNILTGQITITNSTFPQVGDTLNTAFDPMPVGVDITATGPDQSWDFGDLQGLSQQSILLPASDGDAAASFPSANIVIKLGQRGELYYNSNSSTYELTGFFGSVSDQLMDLVLAAPYSPTVIERRAPLNYEDENTHESNLLVAFSSELIPSALLDSLPITPDSLRIRFNSTRTDVVDAWGELTVPGGMYDVLREKRTAISETRLDVKIGFGPIAFWQDVTDLLPFLDFLGGDTTETYIFLNDEIKEAIAEVTVNPIDGSVLSVEYKANNVLTNVSYVNTGRSDILAYPNPAIDEVRFSFLNLPPGTYQVKLFNILGIEVWGDSLNINGNHVEKVNLSKLRKGTYLYSLVNEKGKTITTKRLVVIRP